MKYSIIGAGIGGLATALAFEKIGVAYHVYERASEISEVGAGIWLAPNALQVLDYLGILEEVLKSGNAIDRITIGKADLTSLSDSFQDVFKKEFGFSTIAIHRATLQKILVDKLPKEKISFGKGFQSFVVQNDKSILINFRDDTTIPTDFLIGADGIHSKVRKQLFPQSSTRYSGQTCWRGIADFTIGKEFENRGLELWGDQIRFGISKIAEGKVYWFAVVKDKQNQKDIENGRKQKILKRFEEFHPLVKEVITATAEINILRNDISDLKPLENWSKGAISLIGDAAHATTPNMGQGGAQAIEDAYYLSKLIQANPNKNSFEQFQVQRQPKVNAIVKQSWTLGQMAHWRYGKLFRNFLLKSMPTKIMESKMQTLYRIEK